MFKFLFAFVFASVLLGCATSGTPINKDNLNNLEQGVTTQAEVREMFGPPYSSGLGADGETFWLYTFAYSQTNAASFVPVVGLFAGGVDTETENLQIWFNNDEQKTLKNFQYTESGHQTRSGPRRQ